MLCCKIIKSLNNLKLKVRTEFPNVWGEYKYHSNPYIQGTTNEMCARICTSPNSSTDSSPQNVLTYISLGQEASYTVLIDLGLTELRNVRDSAAPRSYVDWRSRAFSDLRSYIHG